MIMTKQRYCTMVVIDAHTMHGDIDRVPAFVGPISCCSVSPLWCVLPRRAKDRQGSRIVEATCEFLRNRHDAPPNMHIYVAILPRSMAHGTVCVHFSACLRSKCAFPHSCPALGWVRSKNGSTSAIISSDAANAMCNDSAAVAPPNGESNTCPT